MNGLNGATAPPPALWSEARNADGRVYYYNTLTKATQWAKPVELMSPAERALADQPWKEYTAEGGRKYWYNTETKASSWEIPESYKVALANTLPAALPPKPVAPVQQFVAGGYQQRDRDDYSERVGPDRQIGFGQDTNGNRGPQFVKSNDPEYNSYEEAEAAFIKLLRRCNVQPDWTWEQTMRATIKDPQYRAVKDPKDRKAAFEKYVAEVKLQEKDKAKERLSKLRSDFGTMLRSHREIKHYTRWKTAKNIIQGEAIFRSTDDDNERRQLFEEYIIDLKKANAEREMTTRKNAMDELVTILNALDLEPYTRWSDAHTIIQSNDIFSNDEKFKSLTKSDILTAFENHIKTLERTFNDERQREKASKARKDRQNRDRYLALLKELRSVGKIKAGSKWMHIHPEIESDPRYLAMLGQSGSTPLNLFRDIVEEEERAFRLVRNDVYDVLEDRRFEITPKTTFIEFESLMLADRRTGSIPHDTLALLFDRLLEKVNRRSEDDKHASERHARRAIDALRSRIKHLDNPSVVSTSTWEVVRPQIANFDEFKALESDDLRKQAFDKVIRRLKEKDEDIEREREARAGSGKRDYRERDRERDRDRDRGDRDRDRYAERRSKRASRSPEPDAYEADRRKAIEARERQYRKAGGPTGLSPPPTRDRRSLERDRHERISSRHNEGRLGGYDRERERERERDTHGGRDRREDERERMYRTRGDPRGSRDELDYGGGASAGNGGSGRRRRGDSEGAESVGSRKRARKDGAGERERKEKGKEKGREKEREKEKEEEEAKKEEVALHSGSEEGEMVEE